MKYLILRMIWFIWQRIELRPIEGESLGLLAARRADLTKEYVEFYRYRQKHPDQQV